MIALITLMGYAKPRSGRLGEVGDTVVLEAENEAGGEKVTRGKGRGSNFFALEPEVLERLWKLPTANRLNLALTYLVLLAGTGSDHRLTKWSAKACDEYVGVGKPRAKAAIEELIAGGLVERTENSSRMLPQYRLPGLPRDAEPIFLPMQIVTGFTHETPILRRVRECGDPLLLRMLIDLYGLVTTDAMHGIPLGNLCGGRCSDERPTARKLAETGAHAVWAFQAGGVQTAKGEWAGLHSAKGAKGLEWQPFWDRLKMLRQIGAIYDEPWIFSGEADDAEPLLPLDHSGFYAVAKPTLEAQVTFRAIEACHALVGPERSYLFEQGYEYMLPLPVHHQQPAYRLVTRMRAEADTPGHRRAYAQRRTLLESRLYSLEQIVADAAAGQFARPPRQRTRAGAA
ncbi:MAG: hypothetical protein QOF41_2403 [Methylobacteriaceae bacterium]|nr:hypothetical protein [Methylobacteriaceae bacterium]